jgi:hypothetical protein
VAGVDELALGRAGAQAGRKEVVGDAEGALAELRARPFAVDLGAAQLDVL